GYRNLKRVWMCALWISIALNTNIKATVGALGKYLPKIGKYVPRASIVGFLFVLGAIVTLPDNAQAALTGDASGSSLVGGMTMVVTAISDPFLGMLSGVIMQFLLGIFGV